jgi:hypothetical protein
MRKARIAGLVERVLLDVLMSMVAFVVQRQLNKTIKRRKARQAQAASR